jgi:hypothetical protein
MEIIVGKLSINFQTLTSATVFELKGLREQFSLHQGDLFDLSEIRNGLGSSSRLYRHVAFIAMVPEPEVSIDDRGLNVPFSTASMLQLTSVGRSSFDAVNSRRRTDE